MSSIITRRISALTQQGATDGIVGIKRGIERESLRINQNGSLAQTPHAKTLGSALTHPWITTDFSEALLEFITPASADIKQTLAQLSDIHRFTIKQLGNERLWPASMPCYITDQEQIPLAQYGASNVGRMKTLYRQGLKNRYGSMMQAISGVHFNFSLPAAFWQVYQQVLDNQDNTQDFISEQYLSLIRNYKRYAWLIVYLFGASPAMCQSFLEGRTSKYPFQTLGKGTLYLPYATSLRMSDLGYTNSAQSALNISYNSLPEYISGLHNAVSQPSTQYQSIGLKTAGQWQQLNANVLQIENEFYSTIRPKRTIQSGERPTCALSKRGVEYIEVRALDVNPFSSIGISVEQMRFLDIFLLFCLLEQSPSLSAAEQQVAEQNLKKVVTDGRRTNLELLDNGQPRLMQDWAEQLFADMMPIAKWLDTAYQSSDYQATLKQHYLCLLDPAQTLSGKLLNHLLSSRKDNGTFMRELAEQYRTELLAEAYQFYQTADFEQAAAQSLQQQQQIEENDTLDFDAYIQQYFAEVPACVE